MSSSPNVNISRPRPFASLSRPVRRSTGSAPEEIQRSLTAAVRKISTTSLPAINKLQVSAPAVAPAAPAPAAAPAAPAPAPAPAAPANTAAVTTASVNAATTHSQGVTPTPPPEAMQCVAIPPMLPLSPVFSAVSAEPLQPQPLAPNAGRLPSGGVPTPPQTPSTPKRLQDDFQEDFGDKYAALAHLDSAFSDPQASAPSTSIDWNASESAGEAGEAAETSPGGPGDAAQVEGRGVSSQGHLRSGGGQVVGRTDTPQNPRELPPTPANHPGGTSTTNPFSQHPTPTTAPPATLPDTLDLGGDKYAALAALDSTTTVNWGPSPSAEEESEKTGRAPEMGGPVAAQARAVQERTGGINRSSSSSSSGGVVGGVDGVGGYTAYAAVACTGSAPGVLSSSPPSGSMMAAHPHTQAQLYGHPAMYPAAPGTGYCTPTPAPTPMYHHPPTPHPGYAPASNVGFLYPQYPAAQQGIYPVVTTTTAVAGYGAGVVPATVGHPGVGLQGLSAAAAAAGVGVVQGSGWVPGVGYSVPVPAPASVSASVSASASASSSSSSSNPFMGSSPQLQKRSPVCMS